MFMQLHSDQVTEMPDLHIGLVGPLPPPSGGMANQTRQLARLLTSEGAHVEVVQVNAPYRPGWISRDLVTDFRDSFQFFFAICVLFFRSHFYGKITEPIGYANNGRKRDDNGF